MSKAPEPAAALGPAGPFLRVGALVYDGMLAIGVLFLGTAILLPLTGGEAITTATAGVGVWLYRAYVVALLLGFFGVSWTRRGQTLGMMAWRIRLERESGGLLDWPQVALRLAVGGLVVLALAVGVWRLMAGSGTLNFALGIALTVPVLANYVWMGFDPGQRTLVDVASRSRVVRLASQPRGT